MEPDQTDPAIPATSRRVEAAISALRRGDPVLIAGAESEAPEVVLAAELVQDESLDLLRRWSGARPALLITANRAAILHIPPSGEDILRLPVGTELTAQAIRAVADPMHDLDGTVRGPFKRSRDPVSAASGGAMDLVKAGAPFAGGRRRRGQ